MDETETATFVKSLRDDKKRLGLTWDITYATVVRGFPLKIVYDGDDSDVTHSAENLMECLPFPGDRVAVLLTPAAFVMGYAQPLLGHSIITNSTNNGVIVTTPAGGAETAVPAGSWDVEVPVTLESGYIFRLDWDGFLIESTGAGGAVSLPRIRKGSATTSGTQLSLKEAFHPAGFGGLTQSFSYRSYFCNRGSIPIVTKLSMSINGVIGAGTWSLYGDGNDQLKIVVTPVGLISQNAASNLMASV